MVKNNKKDSNTVIYEMSNKKYTVTTKSIENAKNIDKLYEIICKYAISKIKENR